VLYRIDTNRCPAKPQRQFVTSTLADPLFGESEVSPIEMTGTSGRRELNVRERVIPANAPFLFEVSARRKTYRTPGVTCLVAGAFVPHQSGEYELSHTMDDQGCQAQVFRISQEPDGNIRRTAEPTHRGVPALADLEYCRWREALAHGTTVLPDQDTAARMRLTIAPRIDVAPSTGTHEIAIPESRR
jgi:hypothetical protein